MKIVFDNIIFSLQKSGGISVYWYELLKRFLSDTNKDSDGNRLKQDIDTYQLELADNNLFSRKLHQETSFETKKESSLSLKILRYLSFRQKVGATTLFHSSYYRYAPGAINVVTVYDFTYEYYRTGLAKKVHVWQQAIALKKASGIICISEHTKKDLHKFHPEIKVPIEVIYMGKSEDFLVLDRQYEYAEELQFLVSKKFCIFIGDRRNYKNFEYLVKHLPKNEFLVIIGGGDLAEQEKRLLNKHLGDNFYHFLRPSIKRLNELYNLAFCLIYPSDYEGFGIPVIEAMAAGCPVVCQSVSSLTEVAGDAGVFIDLNVKSEEIGSLQYSLSLLEDKDYYQNMVDKGLSNANQFSWDKCYQQTRNFYESIS